MTLAYHDIPPAFLMALAMQPGIKKSTRRDRIRAALKMGGTRLRVPIDVPVIPKSARDIISDVAKRHRLPPEALWLKTRVRQVVRARHEAMRLVAKECRFASKSMIGKWFGLDHSAVIYAIKKGCGERVDSELGLRAQESVAA
jgi:hypothetical protein